jgi:4-amino-4-deoxy-L-arabinose transferase-like glycosyltransferase
MKHRLKIKFSLSFILIIFLAVFLRLYKINSFPPSLYWEEVALGYDAYSILQTGKDHHGNSFPIVAFESFGDWKPSLYFYVLVPFIWLLGLNDLAVRLPAVLSGVLIVIAIGIICRYLAEKIKQKYRLKNFEPQVLGKIAMLIASISPWAIQFSRAAWEVNLATCLISWSVVTGYKFISLKADKKNCRQRYLYFFATVIMLSLSMYCYHAARVISPLLGLAVVLMWLKKQSFQIKKSWLTLSLGIILAIILTLPLLMSLKSEQVSNRFAETSIFSNLEIIEESNLRRQQAGNSLSSRIFYHRYTLFAREVLKNYLSHFRLDFLFISGDINPRHSVQFVGQLYHIELLFLIIGLFFLIKYRHYQLKLILWWILIGVLPASLTEAAPHALRTLPTMPVFLITISFGVYIFYLWLLELFRKNFRKSTYQQLIKKVFIGLIGAVYLFEFCNFWRYYSKVYAQDQSQEWQYGYQEMIEQINQFRNQYSDHTIYITREQGRPSMYYFFYSQVDPKRVQEVSQAAKKDQSELLEYESIKFINSTNEVKDMPAILAASLQDFKNLQNDKNRQFKYKKLGEVKNLNGQEVWGIYLLK